MLPVSANLHLPGAGSGGFSLLELLVVVGLVAALCASYAGGFGGGQAAALQSAQAIVAELVATARTRAVANAAATRLLVNQRVAGPSAARRYLRCLVLQEQDTNGAWRDVTEQFLPEGVRVLPARGSTPPGLLIDPGSWTTPAGGALESSALAVVLGPGEVTAHLDDTWGVVVFGAAGDPVPPGGTVVIAGARRVPPGQTVPVTLSNPLEVRGVRISRYGVPVPLNGWNEF